MAQIDTIYSILLAWTRVDLYVTTHLNTIWEYPVEKYQIRVDELPKIQTGQEFSFFNLQFLHNPIRLYGFLLILWKVTHVQMM